MSHPFRILWVTPLLALAACSGKSGAPPIVDNFPPQAAFTASVDAGVTPLSVDFNAATSSDVDGTIASYQWDFGDGATASGVAVSHTFANPGFAPEVRTVTLTVADNLGATASATREVTVQAVPALGATPTPVSVQCTHVGNGIEYNIHPTDPVDLDGPVRTLRNIGDLDWATVAAGDTVRIHPRLDAATGDVLPYRERIGVSTSGTADQPVRVCGVATADGRLPHISGAGATANGVSGIGHAFGNNSAGTTMQPYAIVLVRGPAFGEPIEHVVVEGLHVGDTHREGQTTGGVSDAYTYVDALDGSIQEYSDGAACIRVQRSQHVTIRGNLVRNCANGLFTLSQIYEGEASMVDDLKVIGNYFTGNSLVGRDREHQNYLQGTRILVEYNYYGLPRVADDGQMAGGAQLKMRSAGEVIRYNYFGNNLGRALDLVDVEDFTEAVLPWSFNFFWATSFSVMGQGCTSNTPDSCLTQADQAARWDLYQQTYVYGNVFDFSSPNAPLSAIHYGNDNCPQQRRPGTLWFYHNTVSFRIDRAQNSAINMLFDLGIWQDDLCTGNPNLGEINNPPGEPAGTYFYRDGVSYGPMLSNAMENFSQAQAINNVVYLATLTPGADRAAFGWTRHLPDQAFIGRTWVSEGWDRDEPTAGNSGPSPVCGTNIVPGFAIRCGEGPMYPNGNISHHVVFTAVDALRVGAAGAVPIELPGTGNGDFRPVAGGELQQPANAATALPAGIPAEHRPEFQILANPAEAGRMTIQARATRNTVGAIE